MPKVSYVETDIEDKDAETPIETKPIPIPKSSPMNIPPRTKAYTQEPPSVPEVSDPELSEPEEDYSEEEVVPRRPVRKVIKKRKEKTNYLKLSFIGAFIAAAIYLMNGK